MRKRGTRAFMLPGGQVEAGETPLVALHEEQDLHLAEATPTPLGQFRAAAAHEAARHIDACVYLPRLPYPVPGAADLAPLQRTRCRRGAIWRATEPHAEFATML